MGQDPGQAGQKLDAEPERTPEQVRAEIEQTRAELGDTVAALAEKTDVKRKAHEAIDNAKVTASDTASNLKETISVHRVAVAGAGVVVLAILIARRRASS